jgi:hypothetical protein
MAIDVGGAARAVAEAALGDVAPKKKHGLSPWQGLAIGAALVTAGHVATGPGGRFVRDLVQDHSSGGSREDEEPDADQDDEREADQNDEPEAEQDDDEPEAEQDDDEPELEDDDEPEAEEDDEPELEEDDEPEAEEEDDEPEAEADDEAGLEEDPQTDAEGEGDRPGRPRHPLFERSRAGEGAQRRSSQSAKSRKPKGRRRVAPPRRPSHPRTPARA